MIERLTRNRKNRVPFSLEQFYLIEVREGQYQFIDKETLVVISCGGFSDVQKAIVKVLNRYKYYDVLSRKIRGCEFYVMTEEEKEAKRVEIKRKGEQLSYVLDEIISEYLKSIDNIKTTKKSLLTSSPSFSPEKQSLVNKKPLEKKSTQETQQTITRPLRRKKHIIAK